MFRLLAESLGPLPVLRPRPVGWNRDLDAALVTAPGTDALRTRLHEPGALVVTTGQQPGLFTGPLYTVHKALAAAALARVLTHRWRRPVVPLFWVAGDDHDFAEASTATWLSTDGALVDWTLPPRARTAPQMPMSVEPLPPSITEGVRRLAQTLPGGAERDRTLAWLERHYRPGVSLHRACADALAELLAPHGVLCFDPTVDAFKRAQAPLIERALARAGDIDAALAAVPEADTGIVAGDDATLVFLQTASGRERLMRDGTGVRTRRSSQRLSAADLRAMLGASPELFSANVLLRPVVESALLPTVGYVGGPGELRYLRRQAARVYPILDTPVQTPVPRWSGTLIPRWADRVLDRLHLTAAAVLHEDGPAADAVLARDFPADARQALDLLRQHLAATGAIIRAAGTRIDPVLDRAMDGRLQRLGRGIDDIEHVMERHLRKRGDIAYAQFDRLRTALRPRHQPQERVLTVASELARYGDDWFTALVRATDQWAEQLPDSPA